MPPHPVPIEKPAHIDDRRMRHIADADLFAALDLARPGLAAVRAAAESADWPSALAAWGAYVAQRSSPIGVHNANAYAVLPADLRAERGAPVIAEARRLAAAEIGFTAAHHGRTPLYGFHYMLWMQPLLQAYALDRDPAHAAAFLRLFNQWYAERDNVHGEIESLDVIWYTLGLAIRSLIFADGLLAFRHLPALDPSTHARLLKTFLGAARWLAEEHDRYRPGNWQVTGAATLFELGVLFPEFHEAAVWRNQGWELLLAHLELDVDADGGHHERSPSYHRHVLACLSRAASVAELNGYPPMQAVPRFARMYRWLMERTSPLGCADNPNDSHVVWVGSWAVAGAVLLEDPALKWLGEQFGAPGDIAWALAALPDRPGGRSAAQVYASLSASPPSLGSVLQPASKFALMRSGWGADDLFMAVNFGPLVGHEYESHSHRDALSFTCFGYGVPLAIEAGLPLKSYDDPLYQSWIRSALAHNVLVVDGEEPAEAFKEGDLNVWSSTAVADLFEAQHWGYYPQGIVAHRSIFFVKDGYWIIYDKVRGLRQPRRLDWLVHMPQPFTLEAGRVLPTSGPGLAVLPVLPAKGGRIEPRSGFMAIPTPRAFDAVSPFRDVGGLSHVQETTGQDAAYLHVLYPVAESAQAARLRALPVKRGGDALDFACQIETGAHTDIFWYGGSSQLNIGAWRGGGRAAWLRAPDHWALYGSGGMVNADGLVFHASYPPDVFTLAPAEHGWRAEADVKRQTSLILNINGAKGDVRINGFRVQPPQSDLPGLPPGTDVPGLRLLLPSPGRYVIELQRQ